MQTMKAMLPVLPISPLPPLYAAWMDELLGGRIPPETDATCDDCAMTSPDAPHGSADFFNPQTKCCSYVPTLPNFLVGRALNDHEAVTAQGRATVVARMQAGLNLSPLGLEASPVFHRLYGGASFGQSHKLRCPHYLEEAGGQCGVWRNRNSICVTWFCKHVRGVTGQRFWLSLRDLLTTAENELARWCVLELLPDDAILSRLFPALGSERADRQLTARQIDGLPDPEQQKALWGVWLGREAEFFAECARRVNALTWRDVTAIGSTTLRAYAQLTVAAYQRLIAPELPARLKLGAFQTLQVKGERSRVKAAPESEALDLSQRLLSVLGYFDGRPTEEALARIAEERNLRMGKDLLQRLVDFRLLIEPEPQPAEVNE
jgi:hypothetical protein